MPGGKHILGRGNNQRVFGTAKVGDRGLIVSKPDVLSNLAAQLLKNVKKED